MRRTSTTICLTAAALALSAAALSPSLAFEPSTMNMPAGDKLPAPPRGADAGTLELKWHNLIPAGSSASKPKLPFWLPHRRTKDISPDEPAPPPRAEGRWMSSAPRGSATPAAVDSSLNGKRVRLGGYIVPLDFDSTLIKEFLLVPYVGACVHVPPPPSNQIAYVKLAKPFALKKLFDPVYVTGTMATSMAHTGLADAGYTITADKVEPGKP